MGSICCHDQIQAGEHLPSNQFLSQNPCPLMHAALEKQRPGYLFQPFKPDHLTEKAKLFELTFSLCPEVCCVIKAASLLPPVCWLSHGESLLSSRRAEAWLGEQQGLLREQRSSQVPVFISPVHASHTPLSPAICDGSAWSFLYSVLLDKTGISSPDWHGFPQFHPVSGLAWCGSSVYPKGDHMETSIAYHSYWALKILQGKWTGFLYLISWNNCEKKVIANPQERQQTRIPGGVVT